MVMRSLAIDLAARGITCVVVSWMRTDMGGPNATLEPSERAGLRRLIVTLGPSITLVANIPGRWAQTGFTTVVERNTSATCNVSL